jgi:CHAT domain-containing protein
LTAAEIMRLDLNAELAVLSACQTGRGRESNDSVIGLSRAFLAAGVPSLVVSLWPVPDGPTAFLMKEFYRALSRGLGKAQALREAMLATRRLVDSNPRSWAGFALLGESA